MTIWQWRNKRHVPCMEQIEHLCTVYLPGLYFNLLDPWKMYRYTCGIHGWCGFWVECSGWMIKSQRSSTQLIIMLRYSQMAIIMLKHDGLLWYILPTFTINLSQMIGKYTSPMEHIGLIITLIYSYWSCCSLDTRDTPRVSVPRQALTNIDSIVPGHQTVVLRDMPHLAFFLGLKLFIQYHVNHAKTCVFFFGGVT